MPITKSAKKALRSSKRKRIFNTIRKQSLKNALKAVREGVSAKGADSKEGLSRAYQALDKAVKRGLIKKNTAARRKSRLVAALKRGK